MNFIKRYFENRNIAFFIALAVAVAAIITSIVYAALWTDGIRSVGTLILMIVGALAFVGLSAVNARTGAAVMAVCDWVALGLYIYSVYNYVFSRAISGLDFTDPTMRKMIAFAVVMVVLTACSNALAWIPLHKKERIAVSDNTAAKETENGKIG